MTVEGDLCKLTNLSRRLDQVSVEFCIIDFKSESLKLIMKCIFPE